MTSSPSTAPQRLLTKREAVQHITENFWTVSVRAFERWPVPSVLVLGKRRYRVEDIDEHCRAVLAAAPSTENIGK